MTTDLLVVGDIAWDTIVQTARWPERDRDSPAAVRDGPGGQGFNIATWARAAGARVALVTQIGTCARNRELRSRVKSAGIELWAPTVADHLTRVVSVVDAAGQLALPGRSWQAGRLVLSGYLLARPGGPRRARAWLAWARERGVDVAADVSHPDPAGAIAAIAPELAWLFGNETEWAAFTKAGGEPPACRVIKRGAAGGEVVTAGGRVRLRPQAIARSGDSTGAGDCLMGTFLVGILRGQDIGTSLDAAMRSAAAVAGAAGAGPDLL